MVKLYSHKTKLTCNLLKVNQQTEALSEKLRNIFISSMKRYGYIGFSREIDNLFHYCSTYLYITEQTPSKIVMIGRVTPRLAGRILPFEMGILEDGSSYTLQTRCEAVADINTFTYVKGYYEDAMPLLTAGFGYCAKLLNAQEAYCLFDVDNDRIKHKYLSVGFTLSDEFPLALVFPTFCKKQDDLIQPVRWRVMKWDYENIKYYADLAKEYYVND